MGRTVLPGKPFPLGATWDGTGVNFAIFSEHAECVELCLFDPSNTFVQTDRIELREKTAHVWHGYIPGIGAGQPYGYRVHGPYDPAKGLRFNPSKLLIDPYATALSGKVDCNAPLFPYKIGEADDLTKDDGDSAWGVPKCLVTSPYFDWEEDRPPRTTLAESVIYEVHVKGFTQLHPGVPKDLRGTYAGLASSAGIEHLKSLGVTAVELLPVHSHLDEKRLTGKGLRNYWGYNTLNFFSPDARYCSEGDRGPQVTEFKAMVRRLHREGIEVILDVVYNHTAEGNHLGPMLSFRGIDNQAYYRLSPDNPRYYMDYTGTGNSMNVNHPQVLKLIMDSLRYWVNEMHVDGFRFDLASALARELFDVDKLSSFFDVIHQDPVISRVKLIAEPWDLGEGGYQVGNFPAGWAEWNGRYRDTVRRYWKGDQGQLGDFAYRITGSSDLYKHDGRRPTASINFVVSHDGFTLRDLVSYNHKHNEANGEDNRDGLDENYSWNCGAEGPTDDPAIVALRDRQARNLMATLLFSQGVPMICGGDEMGRTQNGNNNAYCQDNEISWFQWDLGERERTMLEFTRKLVELRHKHPNLRRRKFFQDRSIRGEGVRTPSLERAEVKDIAWLKPDATEMTDEDWRAGWMRSFGVLLSGEMLDDVNDHGEPIADDTLLILFNPHQDPIRFFMPELRDNLRWLVIVDTAKPGQPDGRAFSHGEAFELVAHSVALFCAKKPDEEKTRGEPEGRPA